MGIFASILSALASVGKVFSFFSELIGMKKDQNLVDSGKYMEKADALQKQVDANAKGNQARDEVYNNSQLHPTDIMRDDGFKLPK